jgi:MFS family permease
MAFAGFAVFGAFWGAWGASIPAIRDQAGVTDGQLGAALLFIGAGALPAMPVSGRIVDRWGHRAMAALLALLGVAGLIVVAATQDFLTLALALTLLGASSGAADVAINTAAGSAQRASDRPVVTRAHATFSAAVVVASLLTGALRGLDAPALVPFVAVAGAAAAVAIALMRAGVDDERLDPPGAAIDRVGVAADHVEWANNRVGAASDRVGAASDRARAAATDRVDARATSRVEAADDRVGAADDRVGAAATDRVGAAATDRVGAAAAEAAWAGETSAPSSASTARVARPARPAVPLAMLLVLGGLGALAFAVENAHQSWSALYLEDELGAGPAVAAAGPAVFAAVVAVTRFASASLAARRPTGVMIAGSALAAAGTAIVAGAEGVPAGLAGLALAAAGVAALFPTLMSVLTTRVADERRGTATSIVTTVAYLGFLAGPVYVGTWAGAVGLPGAMLAVAALAVGLAFLAGTALRRISAPARSRRSG